MPFPKQDLGVRFWSHVEKTESCWLWTGAVDRDGYGMLTVYSDKRRVAKAHRLAFTLWHGRDPGPMFVCHSCDNPTCVRPDHLFLGTAADNSQDRVRKGRYMPQSKLTEQQVLEIRARYTPLVVTAKMLAAEFGVSKGLIYLILWRKIWTHI